MLLLTQTNTVFPRIGTQVIVSYRAAKTWHLNETGRLFETGHLFLITYFKGRVDLHVVL